MASQNLPGFAVMRAHGFEPPVKAALAVTGIGSMIVAFFGAHSFNMAAITAAICMGEDTHPDPKQRWKVGIIYGAIWVVLGLSATLLTGPIMAMPTAIIATIAGLALFTPLTGAMGQALGHEPTRFAAVVTIVVASSGITAFGIAAAFWGLLAGLLLVGLEHLKSKA